MNAESKQVEQKIEIKDPCIVPDQWNIHKRINWVRSKISYIQKDATVRGYKAVRHDAVTASLRPFVIDAGITTLQSLKSSSVADTGSTTKNNVPIIRYEAIYEIIYLNSVRPDDKLTVTVEAHALDQGDKAPGKAMSYAKKYADLKTFGIETGEDEESRIEQKAAADMEAEKEAWRQEKLNKAIAEHMDTIQVIKQGIRDAEPIKDKGTKQYSFNNEPMLTQAIEAWHELTNEEKQSIWAAPSKGGPFSTEERAVMKCTRWAEIGRGE